MYKVDYYLTLNEIFIKSKKNVSYNSFSVCNHYRFKNIKIKCNKLSSKIKSYKEDLNIRLFQSFFKSYL